MPATSHRTLPSDAGQFAKHFRVHVAPHLEHLCQVQGGFLALDSIGFEDAFDAVLQAANSRGALHLPDTVFGDLETWISIRLLDAAASREAEVSEARLIAHRVGDACDEYFAAWSALSVSDEGSWTWDYPL